MSTRINLIVLYTSDLQKSKQFYETIGLVFVKEKHGIGPNHYACALDNGLVIELYPSNKSGGGRLGFEVTNLQAVLEALGVGESYIKGMTKFSNNTVVIHDPDNRPVHLSERK